MIKSLCFILFYQVLILTVSKVNAKKFKLINFLNKTKILKNFLIKFVNSKIANSITLQKIY